MFEGQLCEEGWKLHQGVESLASFVFTSSLGKCVLDTYSVRVLSWAWPWWGTKLKRNRELPLVGDTDV